MVADRVSGWISCLYLYDNGGNVSHGREIWHRAFDFAKKHGVDTALEMAEAQSHLYGVLRGMRIGEFPSRFCSAPVTVHWLDCDETQDLRFYRGTCCDVST
jgi:hypothetical protein